MVEVSVNQPQARISMKVWKLTLTATMKGGEWFVEKESKGFAGCLWLFQVYHYDMLLFQVFKEKGYVFCAHFYVEFHKVLMLLLLFLIFIAWLFQVYHQNM